MHGKLNQNVNYFPLLLARVVYTLQLQKIQKTKYHANRANCTLPLSKMSFEDFFFLHKI